MKINNKDFVITISYGNYNNGVGGTDKVILSQQKLFNAANISNVHIFPVRKYEKIKIPIQLWGVLIDGKENGDYLTEQIVVQCKRLLNQGFRLKGVILHHLQWIDLEELDKLLECLNCKICLYLHDYMTVCPYGGLVYNKQYFCGYDKVSESKCEGCKFFSREASDRAEQIKTLLEKHKNRLYVIAPSPTAAEVWLKFYPEYADNTIVIYHQKSSGIYNENTYSDGKKLKVAFVGYQSELKGFVQWDEAVKAARENECNYEYYQFGTVYDCHHDYIKEVAVDFKQSLTAMTDALRKYEIDVAVLWSILPETYSYTYYEAFAANCFILTCDLSGNIAFQVKQNRNGLVLGKDELKDILSDENMLRNYIANMHSANPPLELQDNPEIVDLIKRFGEGNCITSQNATFNRWALWILFRLQKKVYIKVEHIKIKGYKYWMKACGKK